MTIKREFVISLKVYQHRNPKNSIEKKFFLSESTIEEIINNNKEFGIEGFTILDILNQFKTKGGLKE